MKEKISRRTGKKKLVYQPTKLNPDVLAEIDKQIQKGKFPSRNNAINTAVEEKFLQNENHS
jgi:metal-responsive CopG/Arc/MetJ family transcriptional regulator